MGSVGGELRHPNSRRILARHAPGGGHWGGLQVGRPGSCAVVDVVFLYVLVVDVVFLYVLRVPGLLVIGTDDH